MSRTATPLLLACLPLTAGAAQRQTDVRKPAPETCGCPVVTTGQTSTVSAAATVEIAIAARVCAEATRLPSGTSTDDLEAAMVYAVSQSDAKPAVVVAALDRLLGCDHGQQNFLAALRRVLDAFASQRGRRGTAALSGGVAFSSSFSTPSIGIGGGSSNYTQ